MPLQIIRNDITKMECDAIVNAANEALRGGGGVDGAIHRAAGPGLHEECMALGGCPAGEARVTGGYALSCRYIIHTVGPRWRGGAHGERELLASCYRNSLRLAEELGCASVAFPLISAGIFGYPKEQAMQVAVSEISGFLLEHELLVYLVVYDRECFWISKKRIGEITEYIDEHYVESHDNARGISGRFLVEEELAGCPAGEGLQDKPAFFVGKKHRVKREEAAAPAVMPQAAPGAGKPPLKERTRGTEVTPELLNLVKQLDESFSQMLLRKIDEKGMTDAECYRRANVDRKLFSKIRSDIHYRPGKTTVLAFAIALELPLAETQDMLRKAGFALSHSNKSDIIIEYFITRKIYNIFEINEALFAFDQCLLGSGARQAAN